MEESYINGHSFEHQRSVVWACSTSLNFDKFMQSILCSEGVPQFNSSTTY